MGSLKYSINNMGELEANGPYYFHQNHGKVINIDFNQNNKIIISCRGPYDEAERILTITRDQYDGRQRQMYFKNI